MKTFPLALQQRNLIAASKHLPSELLNTYIQLELTNNPDIELLKKAIHMAYDRLPFCSIRIHENYDGSICQYFSEEKEEFFEIKDFSKKSVKYIREWISKQSSTPFPNKCMDVQLIKSYLVLGPDKLMILYLCGHHIIMDGTALVFFLDYLDKLYTALRDNTKLPPEGSSPISEIEKSLINTESERFKKNMLWWNEQFNTEPHYTSFNGANGHELVKGKNYARAMSALEHRFAVAYGEISKELADSINEFAREKKIFTQNIYIFAMRSYLARICETDDVTIGLAISGRSTLEQKSCGLSFAKSIAHRTILSEKLSVSEALSKVNLNFMDIMRHSNHDDLSFMQELKQHYSKDPGCEYSSIMFSYLADYDLSNSSLGYSLILPDSKVALYPVYITIAQQGKEGKLSCIYVYGQGYIKKEAIEKFHEFLLRFLPFIIDHPDISVKEALNKTI